MERALSCALVALLAAASFAQTKKEFETFLSKKEASIGKAFADKNIKWFEDAAAPEFAYTDFHGKVEKRKEAVAAIAQGFAMADKIKMFSKRGAVTLNGVIGTVEYVVTYHYTLMPGTDKKVHVITMKGSTQETWKKMGATWKITKILELSEGTVLMDGKPMADAGG